MFCCLLAAWHAIHTDADGTLGSTVVHNLQVTAITGYFRESSVILNLLPY